MDDIDQNSNIRNELMRINQRLSDIAVQADHPNFADPLKVLLDTAVRIGKSWSQSNLGYHANVYYKNFQPPPAGSHFDSEWGQGTTGGWHEYTHSEVIEYIKNRADNPDLDGIRRNVNEAIRIFEDSKENIHSLLNVFLHNNDNKYIKKLLDEVAELQIFSYNEVLKVMLPSSPLMTRDSVALVQGIRSAPHQEIIAEVASLQRPFDVIDQLSNLCLNSARHIEQLSGVLTWRDQTRQTGKHVFIGHGHSLLWRELKDFVAGLGLEWDEFNRISTAGIATTDRLGQMLDSAAIALLVATAEDETPTGGYVTRQNVVHEIGLFQGRLGFDRAIVLLEKGCGEFSNIHGLGQIRFPKGNISACFKEVRKVLEERELLVAGQ